MELGKPMAGYTFAYSFTPAVTQWDKVPMSKTRFFSGIFSIKIENTHDI